MHRGRVATGYRGASRSGGLKTREDQRLLTKLVRWSRCQKCGRKSAAGWEATEVCGDLKAVSVESARGRPLNLVPPSDFESPLRTEAERIWNDVTVRCQTKAEMRAQGLAVPETVEQLSEHLAREAAERREAEARLEAFKRRNGVIEAEPPVLKPAQFRHDHRKRIRRCAGHMQPLRSQLSFVTTTTSPYATEALAWVPNGWGTLVSTFNRAIAQKLKRRLGRDWVIEVAELQVKRFQRTGQAAMHLHLAVLNKKTGRFAEPWVIEKQEFADMWNRAIELTVRFSDERLRSRVDVQPVKKDVFGYLSKYFSKGGDLEMVPWEEWVGMCPKQLVYISGGLRSWEKSLRVKLSGDQVAWAITNADWLARNRICHVRVFAPADIPIGNICAIQFYSVTGVSHFLALFERDVRRQLDSHLSESYCQLSKYEFDPVLAVGLPVPAVDLEAYDLATIPVRDSGRVPDEFRESIERLFRQVDIPEPVFLGARSLPVQRARQIELFDRWLDLVEVQETPGNE